MLKNGHLICIILFSSMSLHCVYWASLLCMGFIDLLDGCYYAAKGLVQGHMLSSFSSGSHYKFALCQISSSFSMLLHVF